MSEILHPPEQADLKTERAKEVQEVLDRLVETNGWSRDKLQFFVKGIDLSKDQKKMPAEYGMPEKDMAAYYDPTTRKIVLQEAFYKQKHREHYLVHEVSHGLERLIDQKEYQRSVEGHNRDWEAQYIRSIDENKEVNGRNIHLQERMVDDLADFLQSKDPLDMFINRLKRIPPTRAKAIIPPEWEQLSLDQMREEFKSNPAFFERSSMFREIKGLYNFFDTTIRQRLQKISPEELEQLEPGEEIGEETYDWEDEFSFRSYEVGEDEVAGVREKPQRSFIEELRKNIADAKKGKLI